MRLIVSQCGKPAELTSNVEGKGNLITLPLHECLSLHHNQVVKAAGCQKKNQKTFLKVLFLTLPMSLNNFDTFT